MQQIRLIFFKTAKNIFAQRLDLQQTGEIRPPDQVTQLTDGLQMLAAVAGKHQQQHLHRQFV